MKVLITCPPMLGLMDEFKPLFAAKAIEVDCPPVVQTLSVEELKSLIPQYDGWIIGDDPATREVFENGKSGKLKAAVKWGVGVDNVDFTAANDNGILVANTPRMFGAEVADIAMGYVIALARQTFMIDRAVRAGTWLKPAGISLGDKTVALVGFGDIGRNTAKRLLAADMGVIAYDPYFQAVEGLEAVQPAAWPARLEEADLIVLTCALTNENRHMLNSETLAKAKRGVRVINVARGPLIDEAALVEALSSRQVHSAALDVFEMEPLPEASALRQFEQCIFGSHNASNTVDAVRRASYQAMHLLFDFLGCA
ncbi:MULTISPECIES: phosphoglycerate dehydrogenase [unclassified Moorena]|uniref:phosphoglycerate dehydrogenase n=1 Tax=unclassified Moorena TaxID=2683338 RepID=UPI0013FE758F|nr:MULTISPECIES: phosphoglycerate dehydrogenase [unclassified Moorena]NEO17175.1 phosphoglycerate dehydrogenase [Moorena sp. SIO3E8]NEQ03727.1 phosphoglycerate dehydrogenase [Moorena sp. SIO3F7]